MPLTVPHTEWICNYGIRRTYALGHSYERHDPYEDVAVVRRAAEDDTLQPIEPGEPTLPELCRVTWLCPHLATLRCRLAPSASAWDAVLLRLEPGKVECVGVMRAPSRTQLHAIGFKLLSMGERMMVQKRWVDGVELEPNLIDLTRFECWRRRMERKQPTP
jgi:hypothetical protein